MTSKLSAADGSEVEFTDELPPGTTLLHGQYVIKEFLASGGFGKTYIASDSLDRQVVIKECFPEAICQRSNSRVLPRTRSHAATYRTIVDLFIQEARSLARLSHPNIVGVHQVFEDYDTAYMALDYIDGQDLLTMVEQAQTIEPETLQRIVLKLLDAVEFIHDQGILHRDIAPDNILLDSSEEPVLIDFGAARETVTRATRLLGSLQAVKDGYSPQEFYITDAAHYPSSDLYSLGASLYHVMTKTAPPNAQERLSAIAAGDPDPYSPVHKRVAGYPKDFLDAIDRALEVFPKKRFQSAGDWRRALKSVKEPALHRGNLSRPSLAVDHGTVLDPFDSNGKQARHPVRRSAPVDLSHLDEPARTKSKPLFPDAPDWRSERDRQITEAVSRVIRDSELVEDPAPVARAPLAKFTAKPKDQPEAQPRPQKPEKSRGALVGVSALALVALLGAGAFLAFGSDDATTPDLVSETAPVPLDEVAGDIEIAITDDDTEIAPADDEIAGAEVVSDDVASDDLAIATIVETEPSVSDVATEPEDPTVAQAPAATEESTEAQEPSEIADADETIQSGSSAPPVSPLPRSRPHPETGLAELSTGFGKSEEETAAELFLASDEVPDAMVEVDAGTAMKEGIADDPFSVELPGDMAGQAFVQLAALTRPDRGDAPAIDTEAPEAPPIATASEHTETISSVTTSDVVAFPVLANMTDPNVVLMAGGAIGTQVGPGQRIVTVNGVAVTDLSEVPRLVSETADFSIGDTVAVRLGITDSATGETSEKTVELPAVRETALENGVRFHTRLENGEAVTTVVSGSGEGPSDLQRGDRVVALMPWNETFATADALANALRREIASGQTQFSFAVNRNGSLWFVAMRYDADDGS